MKTCFLFPGQGAQYPGMGRDLWDASAAVRSLFELASDVSGIDVRKLLFEGSEDELKATDKTQIAITVVNLAASAVLKERGVLPEGCAGFSLGEYAALVESGILAPGDALALVVTRGLVMEKVSRYLDRPEGSPGMGAVIGLQYEDVKALAESIPGVYLANYNSPTQLVVSGTAEGLAAFEPECKARGARRFIRLKVSGPFHSPLLEDARAEFASAVLPVRFSDPAIPVWSNVSGGRIGSGDEAKEFCIKQIVSTVRWVDEERAIASEGYTRCIEAGPGTVLSGLWKSVAPEVPCLPAGKIEEIRNIAGESPA